MHMFLWLGANLCPQWVQSVFGVPSVAQVDTDRTTIPPLDNPLNKRIRTIISDVQSERRYSMRVRKCIYFYSYSDRYYEENSQQILIRISYIFITNYLQ